VSTLSIRKVTDCAISTTVMPGRFSLPAVFGSCVVTILAAAAGIAVLWAPISSFPASYTYTRAPSLLYAYDHNASTAICDATYRSDYYDGWSCSPQVTPSSELYPLRFSIVSSIGRGSYTVRTISGVVYRQPSTASPTMTSSAPATVTVTVGAASSSASASNPSASAGLLATQTASNSMVHPSMSSGRASGAVGSAYASSTAIPSFLQGSVVSLATSLPSATVFYIHLPRPKVSPSDKGA
jgi:hypothetical protein